MKRELPTRAEFRFFERLTTRWSDLDVIGHVNNTRFLTFDEQGRIHYFAGRLGTKGPVPGRGGQFILAHVACDFLQQIHHPSTIDVGIRAVRLGRRSVETRGAHFIGDLCVAQTKAVVVWFDFQTQTTQDLPDSVRRTISEYELVKPEGAAG